jgi:threonine/homoserine/homoserine lactone efflux protein
MWSFFLASLVVALVPGPDNLFVLSQSAAFGRKAGFVVIAGLSTGICIQILLLVTGLSLVLVNSPKAFFVLQCLGACYLLYLAFLSFRVQKGVISVEKTKALSPFKLYRRGAFMNLTNPKAVIFLLAFLPPAVNTSLSLSPTTQIIVLGLLFIICSNGFWICQSNGHHSKPIWNNS